MGRHLKESQCHTQADTILYHFRSKYDEEINFSFLRKKNSFKTSWCVLYIHRRAYLRCQPINGLNSGDVNNIIYSPLMTYLQDNFLLLFSSSSFPLPHHISKLFGADDRFSSFQLGLGCWYFSLQGCMLYFYCSKTCVGGSQTPHWGFFHGLPITVAFSGLSHQCCGS